MKVRNVMSQKLYQQELLKFLKAREGDVSRIYSDSDGIPTLGISYALATKSSGGVYTLRSQSEIESTIGTARVEKKGTGYFIFHYDSKLEIC